MPLNNGDEHCHIYVFNTNIFVRGHSREQCKMAVWGHMNLSCITLSDTLLNIDISHWGINAPENNPQKRESGLKVKGRLHLKYLKYRNTWGSKWKITSSFFFSSLLLSVFLCNSPGSLKGTISAGCEVY